MTYQPHQSEDVTLKTPEWDDQPPFTPEETSAWAVAVLGIGVCLVLMFITALAIAPHI